MIKVNDDVVIKDIHEIALVLRQSIELSNTRIKLNSKLIGPYDSLTNLKELVFIQR